MPRPFKLIEISTPSAHRPPPAPLRMFYRDQDGNWVEALTAASSAAVTLKRDGDAPWTPSPTEFSGPSSDF